MYVRTLYIQSKLVICIFVDENICIIKNIITFSEIWFYIRKLYKTKFPYPVCFLIKYKLTFGFFAFMISFGFVFFSNILI